MIRKSNDDSGSKPSIKEEAAFRTSRSYVKSAIRAATHPVRSEILKALKEGEKSTVDLERVTGENRYNLYHHLNALEQVGLVGWAMKDNKAKSYHLRAPNTPEVAVVILSEEDITRKKGKFKKLIQALGEAADEEIPNQDRITSAEICLYYTWEEKK